MSTQTGSISFEATGGFNSYAKQNYATLSQIKGQFATCGTGASTAAKVATIVPTDSGWTLYDGATITVKFTSKNTISAPTLNVNGTGAKPIKDFNGNNLTQAAYEWPEGAAMSFTYDGTYWRIQDSNLMERVHSAETAIEQNASEIELRATKEEINNAIDDIKITKSICGRSITTEDAADLPLLSLDSVYGESVQNGTPTPDAPVHIQTVRGKNLISHYNEFRASTGVQNSATMSQTVEDGMYKMVISEGNTGNWNASWWAIGFANGSNNVDDILEDGEIYTVSMLMRAEGSTKPPTLSLNSRNDYKTLIGKLSENWTIVYYTFTFVGGGTGSPHLGWNGINTASTYWIKSWQIEKGDMPSYPVPKGNISVESRGKNLINHFGLNQETASVNNYYYIDFVSSKARLPKIKLTPDTTYTISYDVNSTIEPFDIGIGAGDGSNYLKDIKHTGYQYNGRVSVTFTPTSTQLASGAFLAIRPVRFGSKQTYSFTISNIQLEINNIATDYEPYWSNTSYLDLKGNELYSLPDGTRDSLSIDASGHVIIDKRVGKIVKAISDMGNSTDFPGWSNTGISEILGLNVNTYITNTVAMSNIKNYGYIFGANTMGSNDLLFLGRTYFGLTSDEWKAQYPDLVITFYAKYLEPYTIDLGYIDLPQVSDGSTVYVASEIQPYICGTWWTESGQEAGNAHYSSVKENAELRIAADGISSEVSKISSAKYVNSSIASWTLDAIKTNAADDGVVHTWNISSSTPTTDFRVGDTVYVKCIWTFTENSTTKTSPVYIKTTVKEINSATQFTAVSHGYENVLPVDSIKSTINQSADSVKIAANHVDIEGAAIFSSGGAYDKSTTIVKSETQWYSSTSATSKSGGSWGTTQPTVTAGRYIWQRELVTYANGSTDYKPSEAGVCTQGQTDLSSYSTTSQMNAALAGKADTSLAVSRTQRIYYQSASTTKPATPGTTSSDWVSDESGAADKWTLKRMSYSSAKPYIYTCEQKQVVSGTVSYTPVLLDDTTTVIDGGKIITGSVQANAIKADSGIFNTANIPNLSAAKITSGDIAADRIKTNVVNAINATVNQIDAKNIKASELQIGQSQVTNLTNDIVDAKKHTQVIVSASNVNYVANTCTLTARLYIDGVLQTGTSLKWQWYRDGTAQGSQMTGATGTLDVTSTLGIGHRYSCKCTF